MGSSRNLGVRLIVYFRNSYLQIPSNRVSRAKGSGKRKTYLLCLFYYKFRINKHFFGANQLSKFLDIGLYFALYLTKIY